MNSEYTCAHTRSSTYKLHPARYLNRQSRKKYILMKTARARSSNTRSPESYDCQCSLPLPCQHMLPVTIHASEHPHACQRRSTCQWWVVW